MSNFPSSEGWKPVFVGIEYLKKTRNYFALAALFLLCTHPTTPPEPGTDTAHPGMRKITAAGKSFIMGSNDSLVKSDEKPTMTVNFSYDYWIDTTEVTQGEFANITGFYPVTDSSTYGKGPAFPVYYVSWFDAVRFCNAKSKILELDTVYSYYGIAKNTSGTFTDLVGLRIHYEKDGLRLPTEAEWEYAADHAAAGEAFSSSADSGAASQYAWYIGNGGGTTHAVAGKLPNAASLYDLAGNVFEWTSDWKGPHVSKTVTNPVGAQYPDNELERVIKGGSFEHGIFFLRPSCRSVTYSTPGSSAVEYVGFRCARGIIPNPFYVGQDSSGTSTNPCDVVLGDIRPIIGTRQAKLVFVNVTAAQRTLCCLDYGQPIPAVREYADFTKVYFPTVSPDGKYVAFCTQNVGFGDSSLMYVRSLDSLHSPLVRLSSSFAYKPHWWTNPATGDTCIVYTNSTIDNKLAEWNSTNTLVQKMSGGAPSGTPTVLVSNGSFHDGISANGKYAVTGYTGLLVKELVSGEQKQLFLSPQNGKESTGSTQVCNTSICPDTIHPDYCMFLDFGGINSTLIGETYAAHQHIFISDYSGKVLSWFKYPSGENEWDFPAWSANGRFAVATARNSSEQSHAAYCIDLQTPIITKLVEGVEIQQPYLWMPRELSGGCNISLDSAGQYADPLLSGTQPRFTFRMQAYWRHATEAQFVFMGSSHTNAAIDPKSFLREGVFNLAYPQGDMGTALELIQNYLPYHSPHVRCVAMDLLLSYMWNDANLLGNFAHSIKLSKGYVYDKNKEFWSRGAPQNFLDAVENLVFPPWGNVDSLGVERLPANGWGDALSEQSFSCDSCALNDSLYLANCTRISQLAGSLALRKIHLLIYTTPESPVWKSMGITGRYGATIDATVALFQFFHRLETSNPYFHFYDGNNYGNHDYVAAEANDPDHLSASGAQKFSRRIDSLISTFGIN